MHKLFKLIWGLFLFCSTVMVHGQDLYWIGNGGNWNDANNWSTSSGGPSDGAVPTANNDVYFDDNSGDCIIAQNAICRNLEYNTLSSLTISSALSVTNTFTHMSGTISNESTISTGIYSSNFVNNRTLDSSTGTIRINADASMVGAFSINSTNFTLVGLDSLIFESDGLNQLQTTGELNLNYVEFITDGEIYGNHSLEILRLGNSRTLFIQSGSKQTINTDLITDDPCVGYATISGFLEFNTPAVLDIAIPGNYRPRGFLFRRIEFIVLVQGVNFPLDLRFSINGGENINFDASNPDVRDLYWVGGTGDWYDPANWSLESGGPGGECVPTSIDNVFFDENSFDSNMDIVSSTSATFCNNITYTASESGTTFIMPEMFISNDFTLLRSITWRVGSTNFSGNREGGASRMQLITSSGTVFQNINVFSERNIELQDDLNVELDITINGFDPSVSFITNGHNINTGRFFAINNDMRLDLTDSYISINGILEEADQPVRLINSSLSSTNNTIWEFTAESTGFEVSGGDLGTILFSNPLGQAFAFSTDIATIQKLTFNGNGQIFQDEYIIDSLIFSAGGVYMIQTTEEITVNQYFESVGDICRPITFASLVGGIQENLFIPASAELSMSYTEISDISASGGNPFDAGEGSVDLGGNSGWSFRDPDAQEINKFLGPDTIVCNSIPEVIFNLNFEEDDVDSVIWNRNELQQSGPYTFTVATLDKRPAIITTLTAEVFFSNGCSQKDTVMIGVNEAFDFSLGEDRTLCNGELGQLTVPIDDATYNWSNGESGASILIFEPGTYNVKVDSGACSFEDEIIIQSFDLTSLTLGRDTVLCDANTLTLNGPADFDGGIVWSDGSTSQSIEIQQSGIYFADFSQDICVFRDSIDITFDSAFDINLGNDTTLCNGASITLNTNRDAGIFTWSTGSTAPLITVDDDGIYSVDVQIGSCIASDSIEISTVQIKEFDLGSDTTFCLGESYEISIPDGYQGDFAWSTGESTTEITISEEDIYILELREDICRLADTVLVTFDTPRQFDLGPDTTLCDGETLLLQLEGLPDDIAYVVNWSPTMSTEESFLVSETGVYEVQVGIESCVTADTIEVNFNSIESFSLGNDTTLCEGSRVLLNAPANSTPLWSDQSSATTLEVSSPDLYWLELSNGRCTKRDSIEVAIDELYLIDLGTDTTLCEGSTLNLTLDNLPSNPDLIVEWNVDNPEVERITISQGGTYIAEVVNGSCIDQDTINVQYVFIEDFSIGSDTSICAEETLILNVPEGLSNGFIWSDNSTSTSLEVSGTDGSTENYSLTIMEGTCSKSDTITVAFDAALDFNFISSDTTLCSGESINLSSGIANADIYLWNTGDELAEITVATPGQYILNVERGTCSATDTINIAIIDVDNFSIGNDSTLCQGDTLTLSSNLTGNVNYIWQDGSTESTYTLDAPDIYSVTASIDRCEATASVIIDYQQAPILELGNDTTICEPNSVLLSPDIANASYLWSDESASPTLEVLNSGGYSVLVDDGVCRVMDSINITVQSLPDLSIATEDDISICQGDSVVLSSMSENVSYIWQDLTTESQFIASSSGIYSAEMTQGVCIVFDTISLTVNPNPTVTLQEDQTICQGEQVTLSVSEISGATYNWTGTTSSDNIAVVTEQGNYVIEVIDLNGCSATDDFNLTLQPIATFNLGADRTICEGESTTVDIDLDNPALTPSVIWSLPITGLSATIDQGGSIWAQTNLDGCSFRDSLEVRVQSFPIVELGNDTTICQGDEIVLDVTNENASYSWSNGETSSSITLTGSGTSMITVSVGINGCTVEDMINITTKETPDFSLQDDETICEDQTLLLMIENPGSWDIEWSNGERTDDIVVNESGTYTATATLDECSSTDDFVLSVQPLPSFDLGEDIQKCEDLTITLNVDRNDVNVVWQDGNTSNSYIVSNPGIFTATATTGLGCVFTDDIEIFNRECVSFNMYVPNVFSPNKDGRNDEFIVGVPEGIFLSEYQMSIFDRWGNKVFESFDINVGWNGSGLGFQSLQPGVYVYKIDVKYSDDYNQDITESFSGNLTWIE